MGRSGTLFCPECGAFLVRGRDRCQNCGVNLPAPASPPVRERPQGTGTHRSTEVPSWFPFDSMREGQSELLDAAQQVVTTRSILLAEAPTGLGKTAAALAGTLTKTKPGNRTLAYLVPKQAQHKPPVDTLRLFEAHGLRATLLDVISKQDMCQRSEAGSLGHQAFQAFCRRVRQKGTCTYWDGETDEVFAELQSNLHGVEEFVSLSAGHHLCPFKVYVNHRAAADILILDYNHFFRPGDLTEEVRAMLQQSVLLIDEAHNLPERVRGLITFRLEPKILKEAAKEVDRVGSGGAGTVLRNLSSWVAEERSRVWKRLSRQEREEQGCPAEISTFGGALNNAFRMNLGDGPSNLWDFVYHLSEALYAEEYEGDKLEEVIEFFEAWFRNADDRVRYWEFPDGTSSGNLVVEDLDVSKVTQPVLQESQGAILMSGTLQPFEMYANLLGLPTDRAASLTLPDPFPKENRKVVVDRGVTSRYNDRGPSMYQKIARRIEAAFDATPGNSAVFFPSYSLMNEVSKILRTPSSSTLKQDAGMSKEELDRLAASMSAQGHDLLLGVLSTGLSEGYDLSEGVENVIKTLLIVGVPYPPPNIRLKLLRTFLDQRFPGEGYRYASEIPAIVKVLQAAGRAIRDPNHRAFIGFLDDRYDSHRLRQLVAEPMGASLTDDLESSIRRFHWSS